MLGRDLLTRPVVGPAGLVVRRALADRGVVVPAWLVILAATTLLTATVVHADALRRAGLARTLADAPALVGLTDRAGHRPHELSGGEQQRVAIARALTTRPPLLLADEPTGQLDSTTARSIMDLLHDIVRREGTTAIVATHDPALLDLADRVVELHDGRLATG